MFKLTQMTLLGMLCLTVLSSTVIAGAPPAKLDRPAQESPFAFSLAALSNTPGSTEATGLDSRQTREDTSLPILYLADGISAPSQETSTHKGHSLAEITNKLNNPGSDLANMNFKFTWNEYEGDLPGSTSQDSLTLNFQPVFPFPLADGANLLVRPTIPVTWQPSFNADKGGFDEQFGMGDSQIVAFYARTNKKEGYMWGVGGATQFPTHTDDSLGKNQFHMGPAGFAGVMGKWGSAGLFPQHLWNIGDSDEGYSASTDLQAWYWFSAGKGWQVGGSPIVTYDWAADNSDQAWVVPVNLGLQKTVMLGQTPVKFRLEGIYYLDQPDEFGPHWGLQLTITPVIENPFKGLIGKK